MAFLLYGLVLVNGSATGMSARYFYPFYFFLIFFYFFFYFFLIFIFCFSRYFSLAAEFPPQCIGYMVAGNAMGALLPTFLYFIFNFIYSEDEISLVFSPTLFFFLHFFPSLIPTSFHLKKRNAPPGHLPHRSCLPKPPNRFFLLSRKNTTISINQRKKQTIQKLGARRPCRGFLGCCF